MQEGLPESHFQFQVGEVVHHRRYGYRGVIFGRDPFCRADEDWYQKNQTQPDRRQAWYHVLVHGQSHSTYVAQSNLEADPNRQPVAHPMLGKFFQSFVEGRYYRENLN